MMPHNFAIDNRKGYTNQYIYIMNIESNSMAIP